MTTEQHIIDLGSRLKAAYPKRHTSVSVALDNYSKGVTRINYWAYVASAEVGARSNVSPDFPAFPELAAWVEANWLNKE